jgi:hypothetical protein
MVPHFENGAKAVPEQSEYDFLFNEYQKRT